MGPRGRLSRPVTGNPAQAQQIDEVEVDEGTRLVHEGDYSYEVFVIKPGSAAVMHEGRVLAELGPGDFSASSA